MAEQQFFTFPEPSSDVRELSAPNPPPVKHHPPTPRELVCATTDPKRVSEIAQCIPPDGAPLSRNALKLMTTILMARGYSRTEEITGILKPELVSLPNPSLMKNFDAAVTVIHEALKNGDQIGINGDYDVDGATAVAQAVRTLSAAGGKIDWHIPHREIDGYGLNDRIVDKFMDRGCKLVLLFDHGSHNLLEIARLRAAGIKVVVFDHHSVGPTLPDAIVVNPAQPGCGFNQHKPCASALSFFLTQRVAKDLGLPPPDCGLAALGTIADMVPLVGPNRTLARQGLQALRGGSCRGVTHLAAHMGLLPSYLSSVDVGFYVGPAINAAGRLGDARKCVELLLGADESELKRIAVELVSTNDERKDIQRRQLMENYRRLSALSVVPRVLVANHAEHHQGVVGLTAQGLAQRHARPAFVFAPGGTGILKGSARAGTDHYDLAALLTEARRNDQEGVILKAGGHRAAAGVTIRADGLNSFVKLVSNAATRQLSIPPSVTRVIADAKLPFKELKPNVIREVFALLDPCGQGFAQPRFLFESATVLDISTFEGGRRMLVLEQDSVKVRAFVGPELWDGKLSCGAVIDLIATPATIYRNDKHHVQLSVDGYQIVLPATDSKAVPAEKTSAIAVPRDLQALQLPPILRPRPEREESRVDTPKHVQLREAFIEAMNGLPRKFLDFDLKDLVQQPFDPDITPQLEATRIALVIAHDLSSLRPNSFAVRPEQIEFIRWFLERKDNAILQAPTGSGKTEMALVIASKQRSMGYRTIFCAPTVEIQRQVAQRAPEMIDVEATMLDGHISPKKRDKIYAESDLAFISAIPHVIRNDIERGVFSFKPTDLLIIDEGHHTTGEYPYVPLVRKAREAGARVLLLSATPGQIQTGKSWDKFHSLKELIGVNHIFPLNVVRRPPTIRPVQLDLSEDMKRAVADLTERLKWLRVSILEYLHKHASDPLKTEARSLLGGKSLVFPSANTLLPLIGAVRNMNQDKDRWGVVNSLCAIIELSELYQSLTYQGISGFLTRVVEKRLEMTFPVASSQSSTGRASLAPKRSLTLVYESSDVQRAYRLLAQGPFVGLWDKRSLERISGLSLSTWREKTNKERRALYNQHVGEALKKLTAELVVLPYSDHPKEQHIIEIVRGTPMHEQSIVFVRDRSHALFLTARLSHLLSQYGRTAVALTGSGTGIKKGLSRDERRDNLQELEAGRAQIVVSTSAGNEGIDFARVKRGFGYRFSASATEALQQWGRLGRRDEFGEMTYLCTAPEEHGKFLSILRKVGEFYQMLNHERQSIIDLYAARPK